MQKSHIVQVLRTFSKKETRDFKKWLNSPFHNQREDVVQLFEYLMTQDNLQNDEKLAKEKIFKILFPKEKFDDARIRQTMYFFSESLDAFLIYQKFLEKKSYHTTLLAADYKKRGLHKGFKKTMNNFENEKEKGLEKGDFQFFVDYQIQKEYFDYKNQHERSKETNFLEMQAALDNYYIVNKLRLACVAIYHAKVFKINYELSLIDDLLNYLNKPIEKEPLIQSYFTVLLTLRYPDEGKHFRALLELIKLHEQKFTWEDANEIYSLTINYVVSKINQGNSEYRKDLFNLYRNGIENSFLLENGILSPYNFKNVVGLGIHLKELTWVEKFIHDYAEKLEPSQRQGTVDFNLAMLYHAKKDYRKAQRLLASFEVDDLLITLNAKFLLIKIYVEEKEYDLLDTHLSTMRVFLNRKEVLGYHKSLYKNVIHFTKKINRLAPYTKADKEKLIEEIKAATPLADKEWFIRQVQEL